jgi:hypothetical protein
VLVLETDGFADVFVEVALGLLDAGRGDALDAVAAAVLEVAADGVTEADGSLADGIADSDEDAALAAA